MKRTPLTRRTPLRRSTTPMRRTKLNPRGKTGRANGAALDVQTRAFKQAGILHCEATWIHHCAGRLELAHFKKRSHVLTPDELTFGVARLCSEEHFKLDVGPKEVMAERILGIVLNRDATGPFFKRARALAERNEAALLLPVQS
jgi:hypothetical protein